jgi:hypothetical protein
VVDRVLAHKTPEERVLIFKRVAKEQGSYEAAEKVYSDFKFPDVVLAVRPRHPFLAIEKLMLHKGRRPPSLVYFEVS